MILVDANLLLYAKVADFPRHERARRWLDDRLAGPAPVGLPWESLLAFLRLVTNPRVFSRPLAAERAWEQVERWLAMPAAWIPRPTDRHREILARLVRETGATAALVPDAHLAALAIGHGLILCSTDGDFARFRGLRWENPVA
jgi:toxin-antitoxin system PIN domain toxin